MKKITKVVHTATIEGKDPRREVFKMVLIHNATKHTTTQVAPATTLMGRDIKTFLPNIHHQPEPTRHKIIRDNITAAKEKNKTYQDKRHHASHKSVSVGDLVLIKQQKSSTKQPWNPIPYAITKKEGRRLTIHHTSNSTKQRDINDVKVLKRRPNSQAPTTSTQTQEDDYLLDFTFGNRHRHPIQPQEPPPPPPCMVGLTVGAGRSWQDNNRRPLPANRQAGRPRHGQECRRRRRSSPEARRPVVPRVGRSWALA